MLYFEDNKNTIIASKLKILVITSSYPAPTHTQAGNFIALECESLASKGLEVSVLAPFCNNAPLKEIKNGVTIHRFKYWGNGGKVAYGDGMTANIKNSFAAKIQLPFFIISMLLKTLHLAKEHDIIHAHWIPAGLCGAIAKKLRKKPFVLMMHHAHQHNFIYQFIIKHADLLLFNSRFLKQITCKNFSCKDGQVIGVGIDMHRFTDNSQHILKKDNIKIAAAGRFIKLKGFDVLIRAMNILIQEKKTPNIQLEIAGSGPEKKLLEELIHSFKLEDRVQLRPPVPSKDMPDFYQDADIFVIPSIVDKKGTTEGLGMVAIEAAASGLAVIGSQTGGIPDIIKSDETGLLTEAGNAEQLSHAIIRMIGQAETTRQMAEKGRNYVAANYSIDVVTDKIIALYQTL